ncbi:SAM-dependent methyltransferase [Frigidibacter albus]|uniref:SAM-dependent methyltransferase n=1 Tax=Frigidibacter albus TaxID=1465486 RepID=A0A6L8VIR9_9RHOB|nr:methyltransferase domain-containing protein [Frigidibacter albus]MZQ89586.1 SAM-dependent methyltransferase [Frigidibacter albus]NBE31492.1 SAM-dependent methyltransferase [Frigidibacter albus]GGH55198.1 SAM-dependent methyltransferase [Frigidibacter albus]
MLPPSAPPPLTDRKALALHRARAVARGADLFLHEDAADEIQQRLSEVNRTFTAPAIVTGFPEFWRDVLPGARVVPDDDRLDLVDGAHDLVIHAMCLHWANDPVGQIVQCRRALAPDGLFLGVLFGGQTLAELRSAMAEAEVALTGGLSPRVLPMGEIRDLGGLLQRAGLALPVADAAVKTVHYRDLAHLIRDLRGMGETNALAARRPGPLPRPVLVRAAEVYAQSFPAPDGRIRASFETIFLTGWAPHEGQQKPLRPGSATHRLADALRIPGEGSD